MMSWSLLAGSQSAVCSRSSRARFRIAGPARSLLQLCRRSAELARPSPWGSCPSVASLLRRWGRRLPRSMRSVGASGHRWSKIRSCNYREGPMRRDVLLLALTLAALAEAAACSSGGGSNPGGTPTPGGSPTPTPPAIGSSSMAFTIDGANRTNSATAGPYAPPPFPQFTRVSGGPVYMTFPAPSSGPYGCNGSNGAVLINYTPSPGSQAWSASSIGGNVCQIYIFHYDTRGSVVGTFSA